MSALDKHSLAKDWEKAFNYLDQEVAGHETSLQRAVSQYIEIFSSAVVNPSSVNSEILRDAAEQTMLLTSTDFQPLQHHYPAAWESLNALRPVANRFLHHGLN